MAIKSILVPLDAAETAEITLDTALMVGKRLEAHVDVLYVRSDAQKIEPHDRDYFSAATFEKLTQSLEMAAQKRAARVRDLFDTSCHRYEVPVVDGPPPVNQVSAAWTEDTGSSEEITARRGRLSDLIVMGRMPTASGRPAARTLNTALFDTGRPVLVTPPETPETVGTKVAIAWNGRTEATRAVGAALPFLVEAEKVTILTTETDRTPATVAPELAAYLACHGITAETWVFARRGDTPVAEALLKECQALGVDLLCMGAFSHSRVRELILGGVTRYVLAKAQVPIFMAH